MLNRLLRRATSDTDLREKPSASSSVQRLQALEMRLKQPVQSTSLVECSEILMHSRKLEMEMK